MNLKEELIKYCQRMYDKGFATGFSSNVSIRSGNSVLITPSGYNLGDVTKEDISIINFDAKVLNNNKPSSEKLIHLAIYNKRPDINAIVHSHAPKSSAFAVAGQSLSIPALAEVIFFFGEIPVAKYALPSSKELADELAELFTDHKAVLMENHGIIVGGKDIKEAYYNLETIEHFAEVLLWSKVLGNINELNEEQIQDIYELRNKLR